MDRNQAIGMILISVMVFVYFFFIASPPTENPRKNQQETKKDTLQSRFFQKTSQNSVILDSTFLRGKAENVILENKVLKITFSSQGGKIQQVLLKNFKTYDQKPLYLLDETFSQMSYLVPTQAGKVDLYRIFYEVEQKEKSIIFRAKAGEKTIEQTYKLTGEESYQVDYSVKINGVALGKENAQIEWSANMPLTEKDATPSRIKSTISYYGLNDGYDYLSESNNLQDKNIDEPLRWVAFKQQFFIASLWATQENQFGKARLVSYADENNPKIVKSYKAVLDIPTEKLQNGKATFQFYLGPNQYSILKNLDYDFSRNVGLGWGIFGWVNKFLIIPIINFLESFIGSYGLLIIVLGIIVRLILFPLNYKSYIGMAKMRVLKPELDEIKARNEGDMQKIQVEQMELYKQVGINPLAGCIPMLLQMPIVIAVFTYFPNAIELRQEAFLWAEDLSTYDSILTLPFHIPFYGNHVSLFTILMTASTILYTYYANQTSSVEGPMKIAGYIMPLVFMFMLNSYPAGLSYYYLVTNLLSVLQQIGIKKLVNEDKIKAILEANRLKNKDKRKSGFQQALENALKVQQERMEAKKKSIEQKRNDRRKK
ncbi:membrane protein insertase YidC [Raineya orbicola]|jgi:YidC/Oxa1 family membrane protein insertase|uniref:Membrane protein insertase YidC n=1 Tax=Raineya orbicola TaxID=2016530 RepID=A0A2N3ICL5_9BACT|nr:membrane protein insertase YidC [Raineya orbicola]PKQ68056.1 Membrane protein insertase, YidC/Oxa1 family [Raineya orbicola]